MNLTTLFAGLVFAATVQVASADLIEIDFSGDITTAGFGISDGETFSGTAYYTTPNGPPLFPSCDAGACLGHYSVPQSFTLKVDGSSLDTLSLTPGDDDIQVQDDQSGPFPDIVAWNFTSGLAATGPLSSQLASLSPVFIIDFEGPHSLLNSLAIPAPFPSLSDWFTNYQWPSPNVELLADGALLDGTITSLSSTTVTPEPAERPLVIFMAVFMIFLVRRKSHST